MSLSKIKKCLKEVRENEDALYWCERELVDLLVAISEHVLQLGNEHEECGERPIPPGLMCVKDFIKKYKIFSPTLVYKHCKNNEDFAALCAYRIDRRWFLNPDAANEFLKNSPIFKKRLERLSAT